MAGAFVYDAETINVSLAMGEISLLLVFLASSGETIILADGTGGKALHVVDILANALDMARKNQHSRPNMDTIGRVEDES